MIREYCRVDCSCSPFLAVDTIHLSRVCSGSRVACVGACDVFHYHCIHTDCGGLTAVLHELCPLIIICFTINIALCVRVQQFAYT